jgi:hypothetical protein
MQTIPVTTAEVAAAPTAAALRTRPGVHLRLHVGDRRHPALQTPGPRELHQ